MIPCIAIGVLTFAIATYASLKFKTAFLTAILIVIVPLPLYVGMVGLYPDADGAYSAFQVMALSGTSPTGVELAAGGAAALMPVMIGLLVSLQTYLLAIVVLCYRAFRHAEAS